MYFRFYQTTTAGENKITTGEQSLFSPSLPAKFAASRVENRCLTLDNFFHLNFAKLQQSFLEIS